MLLFVEEFFSCCIFLLIYLFAFLRIVKACSCSSFACPKTSKHDMFAGSYGSISSTVCRPHCEDVFDGDISKWYVCQGAFCVSAILIFPLTTRAKKVSYLSTRTCPSGTLSKSLKRSAFNQDLSVQVERACFAFAFSSFLLLLRFCFCFWFSGGNTSVH